jgi:putative tryptophan/tyrosine transport system substrate-binding protein
MDRRRFLLTSLAGAFGAPVAAEAQQAAKIGYLMLNGASSPVGYRDAFRQGLRELGYVEGRNLVIEYRDAEGKPERLAALAAKLVALKVDVIVAPGTLAAVAAKGATTTTPIVFPTVGDPVVDGLVESLPRPGGNVTGLANLTVGELIGKALQLLKEALPGTRRVAALTQSGGTTARTAREVVTRTEAAARALGVAVDLVEISRPQDLDTAFTGMTRKGADALVVLPWATLFYQRSRIVALAAKHRLPALYTYREYVEPGGLMSYGPDLADSHRRSAIYVDRILKGAKPADLPVEQATKFELVINLKTAKALGLTIPPSLLARADQVIE